MRWPIFPGTGGPSLRGDAVAALGFIVAHTEHALLHSLVTGVIYREPALLAKQVTTLDVLSGGRVGLGIGAAWNEDESRGLGFAFPPVAERFERLEEATVGRDYDTIDKTTMFAINPTSTADDIVATATDMEKLGFTAAYIYARDITDPSRIIAMFADAHNRLN